jgi:diadenosine tetraphosphate (Ap4A) HIT family hydrolase
MNRHPTPWSLHPQLAADTHPVASFDLCELRLLDDANYPWLVLVPRVAEARELIDLDALKQAALMREIDRSSRVLQQLFRPHKLNVAALGNVVPQLHVHIIAREVDDPAWPAPVWGRVQARAYEPETLVERVNQLRAALDV